MPDKDIVEQAQELAVELSHERKSAFCKAVTHKAIEARAETLLRALADEVERLRKLHDYTSHMDDCEWWGAIPRTTCTCGLAELSGDL